jgi:hypothetical protein
MEHLRHLHARGEGCRDRRPAQWMNELGGEEIGEGLFRLIDGLVDDLKGE